MFWVLFLSCTQKANKEASMAANLNEKYLQHLMVPIARKTLTSKRMPIPINPGRKRQGLNRNQTKKMAGRENSKTVLEAQPTRGSLINVSEPLQTHRKRRRESKNASLQPTPSNRTQTRKMTSIFAFRDNSSKWTSS